MNDMGVYLAFDVDHISMIPTGGEIVACRHSIKVDDEDLAGAYELIRKLYQEVRIERYNLKRENDKLLELVRDMRKAFFALDIDHCQACPRDTINGPCTKYLVGGSDECSFEEDMRELGIEV